MESLNDQAGVLDEGAHLLLGVATGVRGSIPIEVDVVHLVESPVRPIEGLDEAVVEKALDRCWTGRDSEVGNGLRHHNCCVQVPEGNPKCAERLESFPSLLLGQAGYLRTNQVVGIFTDRALRA